MTTMVVIWMVGMAMNKGMRNLYMGLMLRLTVLSFGQNLNFSAHKSPISTIGYSISPGLQVASNIQHIVRLLFVGFYFYASAHPI